MAIPVWPLTLPQVPLRNGYRRTRPNLTKRLQPAQGPAIVKADAVLGVSMITANYLLSKAQRDTLEIFLYDTCRSGALRFSWPDPDGGAVLECRVKPESETDLYAEEAVQEKDYWAISLNLEVLP